MENKKWIAVYMYRLGITDETRKIVEDYLQIVPHVKTNVWVFNNNNNEKRQHQLLV